METDLKALWSVVGYMLSIRALLNARFEFDVDTSATELRFKFL